MSMAMWPFWHLTHEPDCGIYELKMFAGVVLEPGGKETPIAIFSSLRGHLNAAIPLDKLGHPDFSTQADADEAEKDNAERVREVRETYRKEDEEENL